VFSKYPGYGSKQKKQVQFAMHRSASTWNGNNKGAVDLAGRGADDAKRHRTSPPRYLGVAGRSSRQPLVPRYSCEGHGGCAGWGSRGSGLRFFRAQSRFLLLRGFAPAPIRGSLLAAL
jgi:hypothetical protein